MKKGGLVINAEQWKLWQCCGRFMSSGITVCPLCGKPRPDNHPPRTPDTKPEHGKCDALDKKSQIEEALSGLAGRFRITIERHAPRTLDSDNFWGGCKQLRDAIAELLGKKGDSEADGLEFRYVQIHSKIRKTVLKIQQITKESEKESEESRIQ